nr:MAG TPA: hypothetical protein [Caudoviricetes sp.]
MPGVMGKHLSFSFFIEMHINKVINLDIFKYRI